MLTSPGVELLRSLMVFSMLMVLKYLSKIFYRHDFGWVGDVPPEPWRKIRLVAFLNHTSLFEPVFLGGLPNHFVWRIAAHGVIPAADKTTCRPLVGISFKFVAHHVIAITRERDNTWFEVLNRIAVLPSQIHLFTELVMFAWRQASPRMNTILATLQRVIRMLKIGHS